MNKKNIALLRLHITSGIGSRSIKKIIDDAFDIENIGKYSREDFASIGIKKNVIDKLLLKVADEAQLKKELNLIEKNNVTLVSILDENYPQLLKTIDSPPIILYCQGTIPTMDALAIIGARKADAYAKQVINQLVPDLVAHDWMIVSGGARGADTFAHQATLDAGGKTVAVLGSGLLFPYPLGNRKMFQEIIKTGGAVISEFPMLTEPAPENFPRRNRIIAGLSRGCIVAQAAKRSGASITAHLALDEGRDVFAVPGLITNPLSAGCHSLIGQGAKVVGSVEDVLEEYGQTSKKKLTQKTVQKLSETQNALLALCSQPQSFDALVEQSSLDGASLNLELFSLQVEGVIQQNHAGLWEEV